MNTIHLLDQKISNMIAAGEVIERPAGALKELIENAIDAKSTRIQIAVQEGGIHSIVVTDNGIGMNADDARMAFERHATSKIKQESDLWMIETLGFRGEALPSIASVSDVVLRTCDGVDSSIIAYQNGHLQEVTQGVCQKGTQVEVTSLFHTLPARLKHIKSIAYETSLIVDLVQKLALVNANIAFSLTADNKEVFRSNGSGDCKAIVYAIYGRDIAAAAISCTAKDSDFSVDGLLCLPHISRTTRNHMILFINGRLVKSYKIQQAIREAYRDYLPDERNPMAFLHLTMDAKLVDVNVHPSKWEVRLSKEKQLCALITEACVTALRQKLHRQAPLLTQPKQPKADHKHQMAALWQEETMQEQAIGFQLQEKSSNGYTAADRQSVACADTVSAKPISQSIMETISLPKKEVFDIQSGKPAENPDKTMENVDNSARNVENFAETVENKGAALSIIGQLHASYILAQNEQGLVVIDQHAANERIRYEEILDQLARHEIQTQPMLLPIVLEVTKDVILQFSKLEALLQPIGVYMEAFGDKELICREMPLWYHGNDEKQFLIDLLDMAMKEQTLRHTILNKEQLALMACHSSIRFNRPLRQDEMQALITRLFRCQNPYHCPHGRPVMIEYANADLRKRFDRG